MRRSEQKVQGDRSGLVVPPFVLPSSLGIANIYLNHWSFPFLPLGSVALPWSSCLVHNSPSRTLLSCHGMDAMTYDRAWNHCLCVLFPISADPTRLAPCPFCTASMPPLGPGVCSATEVGLVTLCDQPPELDHTSGPDHFSNGPGCMSDYGLGRINEVPQPRPPPTPPPHPRPGPRPPPPPDVPSPPGSPTYATRAICWTRPPGSFHAFS
ncbi:hypothetical protein SODALDRAFT_108660 [Sodiomyces alkalinus F11]|uniref:Uncharacterized protein n=1 Tax=Sodiomyces alkalinus (strain CBS 110278 / VKM F-3762 / F11) TaxID=1314773 RepID=A0A3N2Q2G3_SODAK|nr:hypothetical protein SODALDRAFT_108660 [Sodiomyces alkalinus F11]ROT40961.1 hypothetical protein SODALDRAFT_108660 [Sodiomyces alkalinus F11]